MSVARPANTAAERWWLITIALALWLGVHALRSYLSMAVWNLADELPLELKSALPIAVHLPGFLAWPAARLVGENRALWWYGAAFAALYALRSLLGELDATAALAAFAGWIVWLWWLPALLKGAANAGMRHVIAPAAVLGISLQMAGQTLLHGLDVPLLRGTGSVVLSLTLSGALLFANSHLTAVSTDRAEPIGRGAAALLGLWFFLQLTLFASLGRLQQVSGSALTPAAFTAQVGLAAGLAAATVTTPTLRLAAGLVLLVLLSAAPLLQGPAALLLVPANAASVVLLVAACSRTPGGRSLGVYPGTALGAALLFVLLFGFYTRYEATGLWPLAGVLLAIAALGRGTPAPAGITRLAFVLPFVAAIGAIGALIPAHQPARASRAEFRALTYNIHQGFDASGLPAPQRMADVLAATDADVIGLQEAGRGWNLLGGADLVAYLRWRFPGYDIRFQELNGQLWGNAILSRWPIISFDGGAFSATEAFRYGFLHAFIVADTDSLHVYSVHLSADLGSPVQSIRSRQARELWANLAPRRSIVMGDFNATAESDVVLTMVGGGLTDAPAQFGLGRTGTWPAASGNQRLDYIMLTADLESRGARVLATTASDHRPVMVDLRTIR